jgi:hypothetical protein
MDQKKHTDGEDEHEWADEKPKVQVKISNEPIKSPSHSAEALSGFENSVKPSSGKNLARQRCGMSTEFILLG